MIEKRFIRVWLGSKDIPVIFEKWWNEFQNLHPDFEFVTITDKDKINIPKEWESIYRNVSTYAGRSDLLRIILLYELGGVYVDTDVKPLKSFEPLLDSDKVFLGKRSGKSFESAVIGCPKNHPAMLEVINRLPDWYIKNLGRSASVQTGPAFLSSVLFGRKDVTHYPSSYFYPYNGFMAPSREDKKQMFLNPNSFPPEMFAAHFSNHRWGGRPK